MDTICTVLIGTDIVKKECIIYMLQSRIQLLRKEQSVVFKPIGRYLNPSSASSHETLRSALNDQLGITIVLIAVSSMR